MSKKYRKKKFMMILKTQNLKSQIINKTLLKKTLNKSSLKQHKENYLIAMLRKAIKVNLQVRGLSNLLMTKKFHLLV